MLELSGKLFLRTMEKIKSNNFLNFSLCGYKRWNEKSIFSRRKRGINEWKVRVRWSEIELKKRKKKGKKSSM